MTFTRDDQIDFARLAIKTLSADHADLALMHELLHLGERIKANADADNAVIYDITEYIYEQIRLKIGEPGAIDDVDMLKNLEELTGLRGA